jgi:hypothetical protein
MALRTLSRASQLPHLIEFQLWNAVNCGSWLAGDEARSGNSYPKVFLRNMVVAKYV